MSRFLVVGAGGIGSWLCEGLVRMLEYKDPGSMLLIIDGDNFEPKNKERQAFTNYGNKADVRAAELTPQFPQTFVVPIPRWVVDKMPEGSENEEEPSAIAASDLLKDGDVVYAVVDNFACRALLFETARGIDNIDVFTGGNSEGLDGSIYHYQRRAGVDVTDNPADTHPELANPTDRNPGQMSCQERAEIEGGTQLIATNFTVAALLLGRTQHCIIEGNLPQATESFFDLSLGLVASYDRLAENVLVNSKGGE